MASSRERLRKRFRTAGFTAGALVCLGVVVIAYFLNGPPNFADEEEVLVAKINVIIALVAGLFIGAIVGCVISAIGRFIWPPNKDA